MMLDYILYILVFVVACFVFRSSLICTATYGFFLSRRHHCSCLSLGYEPWVALPTALDTHCLCWFHHISTIHIYLATTTPDSTIQQIPNQLTYAHATRHLWQGYRYGHPGYIEGETQAFFTGPAAFYIEEGMLGKILRGNDSTPTSPFHFTSAHQGQQTHGEACFESTEVAPAAYLTPP